MKTITNELTKVHEQNGWLTALYTDINKNAVETCLDRLSTAVERFMVCLSINAVRGLVG